MRQSGKDSESFINKKNFCKKTSLADLKKARETKKALRSGNVNTVCEQAKCPNIVECFSKSTATFIILGRNCVRRCAFCSVGRDAPTPVDENEPRNVALSVKNLKLKHAVITSVTRDDLSDKGLSQFIKTIREIKRRSPMTTIEVLTPDFKGNEGNIGELLSEGIEIFGHNIEMASRLYATLRSKGDYEFSLNLLKKAKELCGNATKVKTAFMLGLGETKEETLILLQDIKATGCDIVVIGQYLQPTPENAPVKRYLLPEEFEYYEKYARSLGFAQVYSFARARSSYAHSSPKIEP